MASSSPKLSLLILLVLAISAVDLSHGASHHAPAPAVDCSSLVMTMADCLSFVTNGSTTTKPEGNCCSGLKSVLKTQPQCLCEAFKSSAQFGVVLNVTKATSLPAACKVSAPSATNCGLSETPASAPVGGISPQSSPASSATSPSSSSSSSPTSGGAAASAPGMSSPASEVSPTPAPSPGSASPSLFPISAGSLLVCLLVATHSAF